MILRLIALKKFKYESAASMMQTHLLFVMLLICKQVRAFYLYVLLVMTLEGEYKWCASSVQ